MEQCGQRPRRDLQNGRHMIVVESESKQKEDFRNRDIEHGVVEALLMDAEQTGNRGKRGDALLDDIGSENQHEKN